MKILFCLQCEISRQLGGSKPILDIADAMKPLGWECDVRSIPAIHQEHLRAGGRRQSIFASFRAFMRKNAAEYDVVDFDHAHLPYPRQEFAPDTLLVARSVLLLEHLAHIRFRERRTVRGFLRNIVTGNRSQQRAIESARITVAQADLVNVPNEDDRRRLAQIGVGRDKVTVIPYGLWWKNWPRTAGPSQDDSHDSPPTMVFLGTFDCRKGYLDLVEIAETVFAQVPSSRLKLLGTAGMLQTERQVRAFFSPSCQDRIEVVPRFAEKELPALLRGTTLGIFPSYLEGFGLAILEMVAGGVPVLAYRTPGFSSHLPSSCLSACGDVDGLTRRAVELLRDNGQRNNLARECDVRCREFDWASIGQETSEIYLQALHKLRGPHSPDRENPH